MKQKRRNIKKRFEYEDAPINSVMEYRERMRRKKRNSSIKKIAVIVCVIMVIALVKYSIDNWTYTGYEWK